ncbi:MAG: hypothetical protein U0350_04790 [Caldilineaceae bacterium]
MNLVIELLIIMLLLLSLFVWRRQKAARFGAEALAKRDITSWLLISLLLIAAFGFGALLVYIFL